MEITDNKSELKYTSILHRQHDKSRRCYQRRFDPAMRVSRRSMRVSVYIVTDVTQIVSQNFINSPNNNQTNKQTKIKLKFKAIRRRRHISILILLSFRFRLQVLSLGGNYLTEVPESVGNLQQLQALTLCDNLIEILPASIARLSNLKSLLIHKNRLRHLPRDIITLRNLVEVRIHHSINPSICSQ